MLYAYPARLERADEAEVLATFPDIPEALTSGATDEEALANAADALAVAIEGYLDARLAPPAPREPADGEVAVALDPGVAVRMRLHQAMAEENLSGRGLAVRLGCDEKIVRRILSGKGATLEAGLDALKALGVRPTLAA